LLASNAGKPSPQLDIHTFEVERQFVEELRTNTRKTNASLLIDEFYFEYHFKQPLEPQLHRYWQSRTVRAGARSRTRWR
jgi:hypothetical protein